jgi:hypothetical protein
VDETAELGASEPTLIGVLPGVAGVPALLEALMARAQGATNAAAA